MIADLVGIHYCECCGRKVTSIYKDYSRDLGGQITATWVCLDCAQLDDADFWAVMRVKNEQGTEAALEFIARIQDLRAHDRVDNCMPEHCEGCEALNSCDVGQWRTGRKRLTNPSASV